MLLAVANIPLYVVLGRVIFGDWAGFVDTLKFWLLPDIVSMFRGEYWDDNRAEFKLWIFVVICFGMVKAEEHFFFAGA